MNSQALLYKLSRSYVFVLVIALAIGIFFSEHTVFLAPYSTWFLAGIFFLTALKIDFKEFLRYCKGVKMIVVGNLLMLILFPIAVYYITDAIAPSLAIAFLILAAMPSGMTVPLVAQICGGKQSLALVFAISTSLLAPFTVPLVIKLLIGGAISVSFLSMFLSLAKIIFIPFILANIIKYLWQKETEPAYKTFTPISILLLGLLIVGVSAKQADQIVLGQQGDFIRYIIGLFILFIVFHIVGYFAIFWRSREDRVTITVALTYMNFTLAIYLVGEFFTEPNILIPVVLSVIPWSILIVPFKLIVDRFGFVNHDK
ncbi:MAG: bile acid:sodium symporter [Parcubacteria group bacterium]